MVRVSLVVIVLATTLFVFWLAWNREPAPPVIGHDPSSSKQLPDARGTAAEPVIAPPPAVSEPPSAPPFVHGRVVDEANQPVPDVVITIGRPIYGEWGEPMALPLQETISDAAGHYEFLTGNEGLVRVSALQDGEIACSQELNAPAPDEVVLRLPGTQALPGVITDFSSFPASLGASEPTGTVLVQVLDPSGAPASGARVFRISNQRVSPSQVCDQNGRTEFSSIRLGVHHFLAESEFGTTGVTLTSFLMGGDSSGATIASLTSVENRASIVIELEEWAEIRGIVRDQETRSPLANMKVTLSGANALGRKLGAPTSRLLTDEHGEFIVRAMPGCAYSLSTGGSQSPHAFPRTGGETHPPLLPGETRDGHEIFVQGPVLLEVEIVDQDGLPIRGALLRSQFPPGINFSSNSSDYAVGELPLLYSNENGRISTQLWFGQWYYLRIDAANFDPASLFFDLRQKVPDQPIDERVVLPRAPSEFIAGSIFGATGNALGQVHIRGVRENRKRGGAFPGNYRDRTPEPIRVTYSRSDGSFRLDGTSPGENYDLSFESDIGTTLDYPAVPAGTHDLQVQLQSPRTWEGRVVSENGEPVPDATVKALGKTIVASALASTDQEGWFRFEGLDPACVRYTVGHYSCFGAQGTLPAAGEDTPDIVMQRRPRLTGRLFGPRGELLAFARVGVEHRSGYRGGQLQASFTITTGEDGSFDLYWPGFHPPAQDANQSFGMLWVTERNLPAEDCCPVLEDNFNPFVPQDLRFELAESTTLLIVDEEGTPLPRVRVSSNTPRFQRHATDSSGRLTLRCVAAEGVEIRLPSTLVTLDGERRFLVVPSESELRVTVRPAE